MSLSPRFGSLSIGGIATTRITRAELAQCMVDDWHLRRDGQLHEPKVVVSSNGAVIADFHRHETFRNLIRQADIVDADGMPLVFASRLFCSSPLIERVATTDFVHNAAAAAAAHGIRFYFLGGKQGVAEAAAQYFQAKYPGLQMAGQHHGYFKAAEELEICAEIRRSETDVLWVGLGSPLQEAFAIRNRARLRGLTWIRTCGGLFDHYTNNIPRAPVWMQSSGLEWLHRVLHEPFRLGRRYAATNLIALYYLVTQTHDRV